MIQFVFLAILLPAALAGGSAICLTRLARPNFRAVVGPLAAGVAVLVGAMFLDGWHWMPRRHWHWVPYLGVICAAVHWATLGRGFDANEGKQPTGAGLLALPLAWALAFLTAWLLVPDWEDLSYTRLKLIMLLTLYALFCIGQARNLEQHLPRGHTIVAMALTLAMMALAIAIRMSFRYAHLTMLPASALLGVALVVQRRGMAGLESGIGWTFGVLAAACAFVGFIEPEPPALAMLCFPLAPSVMQHGNQESDSEPRRVAWVWIRLLVALVVVLAVVITGNGTIPSDW